MRVVSRVWVEAGFFAWLYGAGYREDLGEKSK